MKTVAVTVLPFFVQYGGTDVINYDNELKDKQSYVKSSVIYICGEFQTSGSNRFPAATS